MRAPPEEMVWRLSYILYSAWVEARAFPADPQRIFDLADAMHNAPLLFVNFGDEWLGYFREDLRRYCAKYRTSRDYVALLDQGVPEDSQWLCL
jgi:hypothetical protein